MMHIASIDEVSSMSDAFVSFWRTNGRFGKCNWDKEIEVELVTLESLFVRYGIPQFCKIDVEGFEVEVLKGLNQPIPQLSFEFTPGLLEPFIKAMDRIDSLGNYEFNYSSGESMKMDLPRFVSSDSIRNAIGNISESACYTDIYARKKD